MDGVLSNRNFLNCWGSFRAEIFKVENVEAAYVSS